MNQIARRVLVILVFIAGTGALFAAGTVEEQGVVPSEPVEITMWHTCSSYRGELMEELLAEYSEDAENFTVVPEYGGSLWTMRDKLLTAIAADAGPDVSQIDQFWSSELAASGALVKVGDLIESDEEIALEDFYDKVWETARSDGEIWSMPFSFSNIALYYNKAHFRAAGLDPDDPPETWEELRDVASALTIDEDGDGTPEQWGLTFTLRANFGTIYYWLAFLWQNGGELFSPDYSESRFHLQPGVEALQYWVDLVHEDGVVPLAPPQDGFENGLISMRFSSTASLRYFRDIHGDDLGMAFMPGNVRKATGVGGANLAIFESNPAVPASWEFVKWLTSTDVNLIWSQESGYLPLRPEVVQSDVYQQYLDREPLARVILEQMPHGVVRPNIPAYAPASREIGLAVEEVVFGQLDPATQLEAAAERVNEMLE